jgi:hypothetical protein
MTQTNGHAIDTDTIEDIREIAGRIREQSVAVVDRVSDAGTPFEQKSHTLMMESVDRITHQWVDELNSVCNNAKVIEQMVIAQAAKTKNELTKLHLLGTQAMQEARRGHEMLTRLADEIDGMMTEHATH